MNDQPSKDEDRLTPEPCGRCGAQMTDEAEANNHGYLDCITYLKSEQDEAERIWFQEGYAQAEQKCEADRKRLAGIRDHLVMIEENTNWQPPDMQELHERIVNMIADADAVLEDQPDDA